MVRLRLLPGIGTVVMMTASVHRGQLEVLALPRDDIVDVHPVELLEGTAATFDDEEIDDEDGDEQTARKDIPVGEVDLVGDERGEEPDQEVPEPVGGGGQGHTLGAVLGGEELRGDSPDHGAPE